MQISGYIFFRRQVMPDNLFLWKCDQEGGKISHSILEWFKNVNLLDGMRPFDYQFYTLNQMKKPEFYEEIKKLISAADFGINDVKLHEDKVSVGEIERMPVPLIKVGVKAIHQKYDENGKRAGVKEFDLGTKEYDGTRKYYCLSAPFIDTLRNGKILLVDELDASLHPLLTMALISLFNNP